MDHDISYPKVEINIHECHIQKAIMHDDYTKIFLLKEIEYTGT